ncbi:MAG TPA: TRAP transporter substrate-binding protein DctP [Longimicrobiales bacterium]|nr:TRAP transporter substrate-binding protein DctP [Longimicrobiales bacterium]
MAADGERSGRLGRRRFLGHAAAGATAAVASACGRPDGEGAPAVVTRPAVQWRLASSFPRGLDALYGSAERLAARLEALTEGRFRIRPYAAGELVPALQVLDAAQQGTVQIGHSAGYYYTGKNEALAFDTGVPFGLTSRQQTAWLHEGGGLDLMRRLYADFGVISFPGGNTGVQMGGWFKREIRGVADLRGLKMRIPGMGGAVLNRLGVTVQVLGGAEIYPALERGAIDATEWVGPYDDEKLGFHNAARYYYYPGWWEPGPSMSFMVNRQAWDRLPTGYQDAFTAAATFAAAGTQAIYDVRNPQALERLIAGGTALRRFSPEIMTACAAASRDLLEQSAARDAAYRGVYNAFRSFRDDSFRWFATAEHAYADFAYGAAARDGRTPG